MSIVEQKYLETHHSHICWACKNKISWDCPLVHITFCWQSLNLPMQFRIIAILGRAEILWDCPITRSNNCCYPQLYSAPPPPPPISQAARPAGTYLHICGYSILGGGGAGCIKATADSDLKENWIWLPYSRHCTGNNSLWTMNMYCLYSTVRGYKTRFVLT